MKIADLFIKLGLKSRDFEQGINKAKQKTNAFSSGIKKIGGLIAGAFAVERVIAFASELLKLGGEAEGVRAAFNRIADDRVLRNLQDATAGTVSELELMKRAVSASNLGLPVKNLASLFEFATKRAQETGESVDYLVNSIVTGIGRKSPLILDNLGISAIALREKLDGVSLGMASVGDVAKAVGEIASEAMEESGDIIDTNAIKVQNLKAQWEDLKLSIAESDGVKNFFSGVLREVKEAMTIATTGLTVEQLKKITDATDGLNEKRLSELRTLRNSKDAVKELAKEYDIGYRDMRNAIDGVIKKREENTEAQKKQNKEVEEFNNLLSEVTVNSEENNEVWEKKFQTWDENNQKAQKQLDLLELIDSAHNDLNRVLKKNVEEANKFFEAGTKVNANEISGEYSNIFGAFSMKDEPEQNTDNFVKILKNSREWQEAELENWSSFKNDMAMLAVDFGVDVVDEFGRAMGNLLATGEFPDDFGNNILKILGGFLSNLGKMMISLGVASEVFQSLLKSAFTNPASAIGLIAAGAALVAIGGAIQSAASAGPKGGSSSANNASFNVRTVNETGGKLVAEVRGNQLAFVLNKYNSNLSKI